MSLKSYYAPVEGKIPPTYRLFALKQFEMVALRGKKRLIKSCYALCGGKIFSNPWNLPRNPPSLTPQGAKFSQLYEIYPETFLSQNRNKKSFVVKSY